MEGDMITSRMVESPKAKLKPTLLQQKMVGFIFWRRRMNLTLTRFLLDSSGMTS